MRMSRVHGVALSACAALLFASPAAAAGPPQFGLGVTVGAAGVGPQSHPWGDTVFHLGARGDVLFGRGGSTGFGAGPYVEVMTHDFGELQTGAGASLLLPVTELYPIVVSGGGYVRIPWRDTPGPIAGTKYGVEPGLAGSIFFGTRSYNFHSAWEITVGLLAQARVGLGDSHETSFVVAAQLDMAALWIPIVFIVHGLQESPEAARIK